MDQLFRRAWRIAQSYLQDDDTRGMVWDTSYAHSQSFPPDEDQRLAEEIEAAVRQAQSQGQYTPPNPNFGSHSDKVKQALSTLGLLPSAAWADVRSAYITAAKKYHPDRMAGATKDQISAAENQLRLINTAYEVLRTHFGKG